MKTLNVSDAVKLGFQVIPCGGNSYLPVALPREISADESLREDLSEQFCPRYVEQGASEGRFVQVFQSSKLPGQPLFIAEADYSNADGIQDWTFFGAVKVK